MGSHGYRNQLQAVLGRTAAPYGYTLSLWTSGAVTIRYRGLPSTVDVLLLLAGASGAFLLAGIAAYGRLSVALAVSSAEPVRMWGAMHLPAVGVCVLLSSAVAHLLRGPVVWALVGAIVTGGFVLTVAAQFWIAARHGARQPN